MMKKLKTIHVSLANFSKLVDWAPPLFARVVIGYMFFVAGRGKLFPEEAGLSTADGLDRVAKYFETLNIPMPWFNALLASGTEFFGGALFIIGLGTRYVGVGLAFTMFIAMITAHNGDWGGDSPIAVINSMSSVEVILYMMICLLVVTHGAGKASLDHLIKAKV